MWQSWVVFGEMPRHRSLSTGRNAIETQKNISIIHQGILILEVTVGYNDMMTPDGKLSFLLITLQAKLNLGF